MKAIGDHLFHAVSRDAAPKLERAHQRVSARELGLPEAWFRDAIHADPELVIAPCREAGRVPADESWLAWGTEVNFGTGPVDVLLISSRGRIGIVETKLAYNPEGRRTVVAQLLDYALALQERSFDDLPPLPRGELAPDEDDVRDCLAAGRFLLVVAGDALDARAVRLSEGVLGRHLTAEWDLAMVDLNLFSSQGSLLVVPELRGTVMAEVRQVVRVVVEGEQPRARVEVERYASDGPASARGARLSRRGFLSLLNEQALGSAPHAEQVLEVLEEVARRHPGRLELEFQSSSANLYVLFPECRRRVLSLTQGGHFRVHLHYLSKRGYFAEAAAVRDAAVPLVRMRADTNSEAVLVTPEAFVAVSEAIGRIASAIAVQPARRPE